MPVQYILLGIFGEAETLSAKASLDMHGASYVYKEPNGLHETVTWLDKHGMATYPIALRTDGTVVGGLDALKTELEENHIPIIGDYNAPDILFKKLSSVATIPTYGSEEAAGMDLYMACVEMDGKPYPAVAIGAGQRRLIKTNIQTSIPSGHYGRIAPRSGLAHNQGIIVMAGVIDSDYNGDIGVILYNSGSVSAVFTCGDRIAQIIIEKMSRCNIKEVSEIDDTKRGSGGFGSTGT